MQLMQTGRAPFCCAWNARHRRAIAILIVRREPEFR